MVQEHRMRVVIGMTFACAFAALIGAQPAVAAPPEKLTATELHVPETPEVSFEETPLDHPISLESAMTLRTAYSEAVLAYRFESDTIVGDFWRSSNQSAEDFLSHIEHTLRTAPEVVAVYTLADTSEKAATRSTRVLATDLPIFDAPTGQIPESAMNVNPRVSIGEGSRPQALAANERWDPNQAFVDMYRTGETVTIHEQYGWLSVDPFNAPYLLADHWGMEFQVDFHTTLRPPPTHYPIPPNYGSRPYCGWGDYKDWASVSNDVFNWYGLVSTSSGQIMAPGIMGLYGDYNDLLDECTRSSISVGLANPDAFPSVTQTGTQFLHLYLFPDRGQDDQSVVSGVVQAVDRGWCESNPSMPLTDCMGVLQQTYPGPGPGYRPTLSASRGWTAPPLCWFSEEFGNVASATYECGP